MKQQTTGFTPVTVYIDNQEVPIFVSTYPDGTTNYTLDFSNVVSKRPSPSVRVEVDSFCGMSKDGYLWELNCIADVLRFEYEEASLSLCYLPHGRAERRFGSGWAVPLRVFFNSLSPFYTKVFVNDAHNLTALERYASDREIVHISLLETINISDLKLGETYDVLIAPDQGALDKVLEVAAHYNKPVVHFTKVREGDKIVVTAPSNIDAVSGKRVLICDDICDGGGTFLAIAEELSKAGAERIDLFVTHGIFSKGLDVFEGKIDYVLFFNKVGSKR